MSRNQARNDRNEERPSESELGGMPCCAEGANWAGSSGDMGQMMQACHCAGWFRRHRLAVYTAAAVVGLGFLMLQVGWILGVVAFFRTL